MRIIKHRKTGFSSIISRHKFSKITKITLILTLIFGVILFPAPFLIDSVNQTHDDNQITEEVNISNVNEKNYNELILTWNYRNDFSSIFLIFTKPWTYPLLEQELFLLVINH